MDAFMAIKDWMATYSIAFLWYKICETKNYSYFCSEKQNEQNETA